MSFTRDANDRFSWAAPMTSHSVVRRIINNYTLMLALFAADAVGVVQGRQERGRRSTTPLGTGA